MKKSAIFKLFSLVAFAAAGAFAIANVKSVKKAESVKADQNWQEHTVLYANAASYDNLYARVKRGDDVGWDSHEMSKTSYMYGSKYVYTGQIWECYGGLNNMYMKSGNASSDEGTIVQTIFEEWTTTSTFADKLFDGSAWKTVHTVDFNMNSHGTAPSGQYVNDGGKATQPSAPTAEGYTFDGWYKEAACTNAWNFSTDTVSSDTTIYAKWTQVIPSRTVSKYKVLDGGTPVLIGSDSVLSGSTYNVPGKPYEAGYTCSGWFTAASGGSAYTSSTINADTNIYVRYTSHAAWTGTINVDLRDSGWAGAAANYAVMFMDKTTYTSEVDGWSTYLTGTAQDVKLIQISYSLQFEPLQMTLVRYNSSYAKASWDSEKWPGEPNAWGQTPDIDVAEMIRIGDSTDGEGKNYAYAGYAKVVNFTASTETPLNSVKLNGSSHAEYFSTTVALAVNQEFKVQVAPYEDGDYYGTYSAHTSITSNFTGGGSSNIKCLVAGTYAFYFDSSANSLYITKVSIAQADEWAEYFLDHVGCDSTGKNVPTGWSSCATEYAKLSDDAKDIVYGATAKVDGTAVERAVARYDHALVSHPSLTKFIVNHSSTPRAVNFVGDYRTVSTTDSNNLIIIVSIVSLISASTLVGLIVIKRRRGIAK